MAAATSDEDLMGLRKSELLELAADEGVEVEATATKRVIADHIIAARAEAGDSETDEAPVLTSDDDDAAEATASDSDDVTTASGSTAPAEASAASQTASASSDTASEPTSGDGPNENDPWTKASMDLVKSDRLNWLLVFFPITLAFEFILHNDTGVFVCACLAIIPLAKMMGHATEELALRYNEGIGGLLNATFGNAVEMIIAGIALWNGYILVVQASIVGSILGNLLLVLGLSFLLGGLKHDRQTFNSTAASANGSLLLLALIAMLIPAAVMMSNGLFAQSDALNLPKEVLNTSHATAIILLLAYFTFLWFSLKTHSHLYAGGGHSDHEVPTMSKRFAFGALMAITVLVALMAEALVGSLEHAAESLHLPEIFIGMILIPLVGNAAEHLAAVTTAMKNKMELSLGIAIGSSTQIALLVAPLMVVLGWIIGQEMSLAFGILETAVLVGTVLLVNQIAGDGESNWLEGAMLLFAYAVVAMAYLFH